MPQSYLKYLFVLDIITYGWQVPIYQVLNLGSCEAFFQNRWEDSRAQRDTEFGPNINIQLCHAVKWENVRICWNSLIR